MCKVRVVTELMIDAGPGNPHSVYHTYAWLLYKQQGTSEAP